MTIAVYGGSFDPIHTGHAMVANFVSQCGVADEVWLMVSTRNPLKTHSAYSSEEQRLEMARLVADECRNVKVSDLEMKMPAPSYTIDTLRALKKLYPEHNFKIIIGSDNLSDFHRWKESETILKEFGVIVYPRPGYAMPHKEETGYKLLSGAPEFGISSTLIREYVSSGWNINYFVPISVSKYILLHKLYQ